jgi:hypothetical protein
MSVTTEQYEKIIRFLDAEMDPDQMDAFEKELASSPEMRKQLDFEQSVRDNFALQNTISLPGTAPANQSPAVRAVPGKIVNMQKWLAIGAAVVTAFILLTIFWQKPEKAPDVVNIKDIDTAQEIDIAQKKNNHPPAIATNPAKSSGETIDLALLFKHYFKKDVLPEQYPLYLAEALMDYESGNYKTLQQLNLNDLPQTRGTDESGSKATILQLGHYYKGLAFLQTNNTKKAIHHLNWVLNNRPANALRAKAQWYLALVYLKENNREKAAELCRIIVNNKENHILVKASKKILDVIGK